MSPDAAPIELDPESIKISLAAVMGIAASVLSAVALVVQWLGKTAWKQNESIRETKHQGLIDAIRVVREDKDKQCTELRAELMRVSRECAEAKTELLRLDYRAKALEQGEAVHELNLEKVREKMVSREFVEGEFKTQNVTLGHQNKALEEIKLALNRKASVGQMPAVRDRGDALPDPERPYSKR